MGYLYILVVAILFSFGGTCAKSIAPYFSSEYITFFRFLFGVLFLLVFKLVKRQPFSANFGESLKRSFGWLVFGAVCKTSSYLCENYGFTHGVSYGNILGQPTQLLFITFVSAFVFKEKITKKKVLFILPCIIGILLVSWNGRSLSEFLSSDLLVTFLFLFAGICAGGHILSQKQVDGKMDILESNLILFSISAVISFFPTLPGTISGALTGVRPSLVCCAAILFYGFVTGFGFYLNAKAIPLVPFYMVPIIQSSMVIFSILWGVLFFHEAISAYIVVGSALFVIGIIGLQLANAEK